MSDQETRTKSVDFLENKSIGCTQPNRKSDMGEKGVAYTTNILLACFMVLIFLVTGCRQKPSSLPPGSGLGFDAWIKIFDQRASEVIQARNNHDPDLIISLVKDQHFYNQAKTFSLTYPDYRARLSNAYLSRHEGVFVADSWNWEPLPTGESWTEDHPLTEFHWLTFDEGKISNWQVMYGQEFRSAAGLSLDLKILQDYASAWSSGNPENVAQLYTPDAIRHEPLLWGDQSGSPAIKEFANNFFTEYPGARLELLHSFGDLSGGIQIGGVFAIHLQEFWRTCDVRAIFVLKPDHNKIAQEWVFYQGDTLFNCGWVR